MCRHVQAGLWRIHHQVSQSWQMHWHDCPLGLALASVQQGWYHQRLCIGCLRYALSKTDCGSNVAAHLARRRCREVKHLSMACLEGCLHKDRFGSLTKRMSCQSKGTAALMTSTYTMNALRCCAHLAVWKRAEQRVSPHGTDKLQP